MTAVDERPPPVQPGRRPVSATAFYQRRRRARISVGTWTGMRPSDKARAHIEALVATGLSIPAIAEFAGIPVSTVRPIARPAWRRHPRSITGATEAAILSLRVDPARLSPMQHIDGTGTRRRLQALAVMGWPLPVLAAEVGVTPQAVSGWRNLPMVAAQTALTARRLYDQHAMHRGPSTMTARRAVTAGWVGPLAWDDNAIDDPSAVPTPGAPSRSLFSIEDAEMLARLDYTSTQAAARLGVDRDSMRVRLARNGRTDILDRFALTARTT